VSSMYTFFRNQPRPCHRRCGGSAEASVRHLGQHGERGKPNGQLRCHREDTG
uniref:Uncharacterized protein n=2 Tax=Ixodes scapularis TaxID=6945 RepID=A0A1S4L9W4_IXOSC